MIDGVLRRPAELVLAPLARAVPHRMPPAALTLIGLLLGLGAAVAVGVGLHWLAVGLWLANRVLDGLDGAVARLRGRQTDFGGYIDLLADFTVYAAIPIGVAADSGSLNGWIAVAVLLATFYLNAISWSFLSAVLARRGADGRPRTRRTTLAMPPGLVEGAETLVLFTLILAFPDFAIGLCWLMAGGVLISVLQRLAWARRAL
jgi:phosphatidylglycerophosphate synthase